MTGQPIESFGEHGMVDLKVGAYTGVMGQPGVYKQIDLTTGEIGLHSTPDRGGQHHPGRLVLQGRLAAPGAEQHQGPDPRL